jgi:hypothetical protein
MPSGIWDSGNLFWGAVGIILTVAAGSNHDLRWVLVPAWGCLSAVIWRTVLKKQLSRWIICDGIASVAVLLIGLAIYLKPQVPTVALNSQPVPVQATSPTPPKPDAHTETPSMQSSVRKHRARTPTVPTTQQAKASSVGVTLGTDATAVGNLPTGSSLGDGSTYVGATDANGNAILNRGGTAIGHGATADPTSIAIGANAHAGAPSTPATGISADPACKNKLRIHMTGGSVTGINGSGIEAKNADVCIETNDTKITGGTDGINLDHDPIAPVSAGDLPIDDERRKKCIELLRKFLAAHPNATHEQVVSEINNELLTLGVNAHIGLEEPTPHR